MREHQEREVMKILDRSGSDSGSGSLNIGIYEPAPAPAPAVGKMSQCWDILPTDQVKVPLSPLGIAEMYGQEPDSLACSIQIIRYCYQTNSLHKP